MVRFRALFVGIAAMVALSCGSEFPTAIRIKLVADPALNTEIQVLETLDTIQLVLDREGGFPEAGGDDALQLDDLDGDGELELLFSERVSGGKEFPLLRLRPASDENPEMQLSARGLAGSELAAMGDAATVQFEAGQNLEVSIPLNLRPRYRPPRVEVTLPRHGQSDVPVALGSLYVEFSKWVDASSVQSGLRLHQLGASGAEAVPGSWELTNTTVVRMGLPEERTIATFTLQDCSLGPGSYRIEAATTITDSSGNALDQDPSAGGGQPFMATFSLPGTLTDVVCGEKRLCERTEDCDPSEVPQFICVRKGSEPGECVPAPPSCEAAITCPEGFECVAPAEGGGAVTCVACCHIMCNKERDGCHETEPIHPIEDYIRWCCEKVCDPGCGEQT